MKFNLNQQRALQPKIAAARTNRKRVGPRRAHPRLTGHIPNRQVVPRKRHIDSLRLARLQLYVCEPTQDRGWLARVMGEMQVHLRYLFLFCRHDKSVDSGTKMIIRTSVPATWPAFCTVNDTVYAGRCNQSAVDEPTPWGPGLAANQFASSCPSWSCPGSFTTGVMIRPAYWNRV